MSDASLKERIAQLERELSEANKLLVLVNIDLGCAWGKTQEAMHTRFMRMMNAEKNRDAWRKCAEELAKELNVAQTYHPTEEGESVLDHFTQLSQQQKEKE